jgi:hypothetical protein
MPRPISCRTFAFGLLALLLGAAPAAAQAESEGDLRRENQRLRAALSDLQQELDAARARIAELERTIDRMGRQPARSPGSAAPADPEPVTIDESIPGASPRALLRAMKASYEQATRDLEVGDPSTVPGERQRKVYERAVRNWVARAHRELKGPIEWHVRIVRVVEDGNEAVLRAQAVDPVTLTVLGDPFAMVLDKALRQRLGQVPAPGGPEVFVVKGVLLPQPVMNPFRLEPGTFDRPILLGPFAEFGFMVDASNLLPAPPLQQQGNGS